MSTVIRIPQPCRESWEQMASVEGGRSCSVCAHVVPDLTRASDAELADLITRHALPKCARFNAGQLDRVLDARVANPVQALQLAVMSSLLLLPTTADAKKKHVPSSADAPQEPPPQAPQTGQEWKPFVLGDVISVEALAKEGWFFWPNEPLLGGGPGNACERTVTGIVGTGPLPDPIMPLSEPPDLVASAKPGHKPLPDGTQRHPLLSAVFFRRDRFLLGWERLRRLFRSAETDTD